MFGSSEQLAGQTNDPATGQQPSQQAQRPFVFGAPANPANTPATESQSAPQTIGFGALGNFGNSSNSGVSLFAGSQEAPQVEQNTGTALGAFRQPGINLGGLGQQSSESSAFAAQPAPGASFNFSGAPAGAANTQGGTQAANPPAFSFGAANTQGGRQEANPQGALFGGGNPQGGSLFGDRSAFGVQPGNSQFSNQAVRFNPVPPPEPPRITSRARRVIVFETETQVADLAIKTPLDTYKLPKEIALKKLILLQEMQNSERITDGVAQIDLEFPEQCHEFFMWIVYEDTEMMFEHMKTSLGYDLKSLIELYYLSTQLKFVEGPLLQEHILKRVQINYNVIHQISASRIWQKKYIEQEFLSRLITFCRSQTNLNPGSLFGGGQASTQMLTALAFDWLGEKCCQSYDEIEELKASAEFKSFAQFISDHNLVCTNLHDYIQLAAKYPVAIESIGVLKIFQATGLIN